MKYLVDEKHLVPHSSAVQTPAAAQTLYGAMHRLLGMKEFKKPGEHNPVIVGANGLHTGALKGWKSWTTKYGDELANCSSVLGMCAFFIGMEGVPDIDPALTVKMGRKDVKIANLPLKARAWSYVGEKVWWREGDQEFGHAHEADHNCAVVFARGSGPRDWREVMHDGHVQVFGSVDMQARRVYGIGANEGDMVRENKKGRSIDDVLAIVRPRFNYVDGAS